MEFTIKLCTSPCSSVNCIWHFATLKPFPRIMRCLIQQKICNIKGHCTVLFTGYTFTTNFVFKCKSLALETNFYTVKHGPKLTLTVWVRKWFWNIYDQVSNFQIQRVQWLVYKSYIWMHLWDFNFFYLPVHVYCITISYGWTISYWSSGTNTKHHLQGEWKNKPLP